MSDLGHEDEAPGRPVDLKLTRRLLAYLWPYRGSLAIAGGLVILESVATLAGPWLTMEAIDKGIRHRDLDTLAAIAALYLVALGAALLFGWMQAQILQGVGQRVMRDLRHDIFAHLQRLPISYYDRHPVGRLMTRVTNDVDVVQELVTAGVIAVFGDLIMLIGIVAVLLHRDAELTLVTFSVLPIILIVTLIFRARLRGAFRDVRSRTSRLNAFLNENLGGMSTVQVMNRERRNREEFDRVNAGLRNANLDTVRYHAVFFPALELVAALAVSLIVWYGGRQVMWQGITLGTLVAFIQYMQRFFRPISDLSEKYGILQQAMASAERIFELLDAPPSPAASTALREATRPRDAAGPAAAPAPPRAAPRGARIEFDGVGFAYRDQHWVIEDVTFDVAPGERVALVGATGSGKSTLVSLLLRFHDPQRGEIRVDGVPTTRWDVDALRRRLGLVLQDPFLFSGTVASNLHLGRDGLSDADVERAAREVHAESFVSRRDGGYQTEVRERGAGFSAGERQLLSFARAMARDPDVLVLDEATSSVDPDTEGLIQDALRRLMRDRTAIVIAHRLSTIQDVDRIVVLHHGKVREVGTHAELLARGGIYTRLYRLQYLGERTLALPSQSDSEAGERSAVDTAGSGS